MTLPQTEILFENHGLGLDSEDAMAAIAMQLNAIEPGAGAETEIEATETALQTFMTADPTLWVEIVIGMTILTIGTYLFTKALKKKKMAERPSSLVVN